MDRKYLLYINEREANERKVGRDEFKIEKTRSTRSRHRSDDLTKRYERLDIKTMVIEPKETL